jgi:hypothetical protein
MLLVGKVPSVSAMEGRRAIATVDFIILSPRGNAGPRAVAMAHNAHGRNRLPAGVGLAIPRRLNRSGGRKTAPGASPGCRATTCGLT